MKKTISAGVFFSERKLGTAVWKSAVVLLQKGGFSATNGRQKCSYFRVAMFMERVRKMVARNGVTVISWNKPVGIQIGGQKPGHTRFSNYSNSCYVAVFRLSQKRILVGKRNSVRAPIASIINSRQKADFYIRPDFG